MVKWEWLKGSEMARWKGSEVVRWRRWESSEVVRLERWEDGRFLILIKGGGSRVSSRFQLFVFGVNLRNEGVGWAQDFLACP